MRTLILLSFLIAPAFAEEVRQMTVQVGSNTMIAQPHAWHLSCKIQPVTVTPLDLPDVGKLQITRSLYKIGDFGPGAAIKADPTRRCEGRMDWGTQLRYVAGSKAGSDRVKFLVEFHTGHSATVTYEMTILDQ